MAKPDSSQSTLAPLPFVFCFPGCAIPERGSALREGTFYICGKVVGRCLSVAFSGDDDVWIKYVPEVGNATA